MQRSRYRILGQVGQGQFGKVFCAIHRETGEVFALKDLETKQFPTHKFLRELSYLVSLKHPNIVSFYGLEHHQTGRYLVMDYCEGGTLRELIQIGQKLTLEVSLKLVMDILSALVHAHRKGIIHCDIKPENILLKINPTGWIAKLSDFGIARWIEDQSKSSQSGGYTGSPAYMAPERFYGKYSYASDLYAVGILLYELLIGERPFSGFPKDLMTAHLSQAVTMSDVIPQSLQTILEKALRKLPQRRFKNAQEMLESVRSVNQKLLKNQETNYFFKITPTLKLDKSIKIIDQITFSNPVNALAVSSSSVYLGMGNQFAYQLYSVSNLSKETQRKSQLFTNEEIIKIEIRPTGCFIITHSVSSNEYSLYHFLNRLSLGHQKLNRLLTWQAKRLMVAIDIQGRWLALATNLKIQVYSWPNFKIIKSSKINSLSLQILTLDRSHGLTITHREERQSLLQLFNRKGNLFNLFAIPLLVELVTLSKVASDELFALECNNSYLGLLLYLKPLKIKRVALPLEPSFVLAQTWGYVLADTLGKIILLNNEGVIQGEFNLSEKITAIAAFDDSCFFVATWSNERGHLYQFRFDIPSQLRDD